MASVGLGVADIGPKTVYQVLTDFDGSTDQLIIRTVRIPRSITALLVGSAVAIAGTITQGITRNPLASPGIIGVNAGASLAAITLIVLYPDLPMALIPWAAFGGALTVAALIYLLVVSPCD